MQHFADAGCPWDYSAEPVRVALEQRYGEQLVWRTVQVGLHETGDVMAMKGYTTLGLAESYRRFQQRYGMPFCVLERQRLMGTWTGARAVKAAEAQGPECGAGFLRRLRLAWFVESRPVDEPAALLDMAREIDGLDVTRLARDLTDRETARALADDMAHARRPDAVALALDKTTHPKGEPGERYTTPTYVFTCNSETATVPGFQPLEAYEVALQNLAPRLERRPPPEPLEFLAQRPGEIHAAAEVAAATGHRREHVEKRLAELAQSGQAVRIPASMGQLWSFGPPKFTPRCPPHPEVPADLQRGDLS
ncbi:MAG: DsbA family protein [Actinomycetota bacterium]|nr:DsbA family protein [Actinomycetota bacterium]